MYWEMKIVVSYVMYLNSYFQTGYKNLMDIAIINKTEEIEQDNPNLINLSSAYTKVDDIPSIFHVVAFL